MTAPQDRQPATEAGRRLLALTRDQEWFRPARDEGSVAVDILAIEREARAQLIAELREGVPQSVSPTDYGAWAEGFNSARAAVLALIEKAAGE